MDKFAGLEESGISDKSNGNDIFVSTTVRLIFRKINPEEYAGMRNSKLNAVIATDFANNSSNIVHKFWISKEKRVIGEIRGAIKGGFYISQIKDNKTYILTMQSSWFKPKYKSSRNPIEVGDE